MTHLTHTHSSDQLEIISYNEGVQNEISFKPIVWLGSIKEAQPEVRPEVLGLEWARCVCLALPGLLEPAGERRSGLDTHSSSAYTPLTHTSVLVSDLLGLWEVTGRFKSDSWKVSGVSVLCSKRKQVSHFILVSRTVTKLKIFWGEKNVSHDLTWLFWGFFPSPVVWLAPMRFWWFSMFVTFWLHVFNLVTEFRSSQQQPLASNLDQWELMMLCSGQRELLFGLTPALLFPLPMDTWKYWKYYININKRGKKEKKNTFSLKMR